MKKKYFKVILISLVCLIALGTISVFSINAYVKGSVKDKILSESDAAKLENVDCIIVLGCRVISDGVPSHMLEDRLRRGVALYQNGSAPKIIMSGDHGTKEYNEVATMKNYAIENGIPSEDIFMDHAGFSTYESMYRAKEIFGCKRVIIVTQEYHLYRALYIANALGLDAYGVSADYRTYVGQAGRDIREVMARGKDFFSCILKPEPTYLGEAIPVWGNGDVTND